MVIAIKVMLLNEYLCATGQALLTALAQTLKTQMCHYQQRTHNTVFQLSPIEDVFISDISNFIQLPTINLYIVVHCSHTCHGKQYNAELQEGTERRHWLGGEGTISCFYS